MAGRRRSLGRQFGWLWAAYAVSAYGSGFGFGAFPLIAILVLHAGPAEVSVLAAAGLAVGAAVAVPLGPWVEFRRKRPVMVAMDLTRFAAMAERPGRVRARLAQLRPAARRVGHRRRGQDRLQRGQRRLSEGARAAGGPAGRERPVRVDDLDRHRARPAARRGRDRAVRAGDDRGGGRGQLPALGGWGSARSAGTSRARRGRAGSGCGSRRPARRLALHPAHPALRPLFVNTVLVNGLIMATEPLLAVLMLGHLGFAPWQYGLAFAAPCVGGLIGSRLARRLVARFGRRRVMLVAGTLRAGWSLGLAFIGPGAGRTRARHRRPVRPRHVHGRVQPGVRDLPARADRDDRVARVLSAWSVTSSATIATLTALWGVLAASPARAPRSRRGGCCCWRPRCCSPPPGRAPRHAAPAPEHEPGLAPARAGTGR